MCKVSPVGPQLSYVHGHAVTAPTFNSAINTLVERFLEPLPLESKNEYKGCIGCKVLGQSLGDAKCGEMHSCATHHGHLFQN